MRTHHEVRLAHEDGATIQFFKKSEGRWANVRNNAPNWYIDTEYRVAPAAEGGDREVEQLRHDLTMLRISVARVAQALAVNSGTLGITQSTGYSDLHAMAETQSRGWNALCAAMIDRANELQGD